MSKAPKVSVVIPTYNAPALLQETLDSVFAQVFDDFEVIVVEDGSTDDTSARLAEYQQLHLALLRGRLRVLKQENAGIGPARDRGIAEARGEYVALLDHDDLWLPDKLLRQVEFLDSHPECIAVSVPWALTTAPTKILYDPSRILNEHSIVERPIRALADLQGFFCTSTLMFRREQAAGLRHGTRRKCIEDRPFHVSMFARGAIGVAGKEILALYRIHSSNASALGQGGIKEAYYYSNGVRLMRELDRVGTFAGLTPTDRKDLDYFLAGLAVAGAMGHVRWASRLEGLKTYLLFLPSLLRSGYHRFVLTYPLKLITPRAIFKAHARRRMSQQAEQL